MAKAVDRRATLGAWAHLLTGHVPWRDRHLLRRCGPLVIGVCLDEQRDPRHYRPTFMLHNLAAAWPALTMGYAAPLMARGVAKSLVYGQPVDQAVADFVGQVAGLRADAFGFADFASHVGALTTGRFGPVSLHAPQVYRDFALLGAWAGDAGYFESQLDDAASRLRRHPRLNLAIIGSVDAWRQEVGRSLPLVSPAQVDSHRKALGLPGLPEMPFVYQRPAKAFPDLA